MAPEQWIKEGSRPINEPAVGEKHFIFAVIVTRKMWRLKAKRMSYPQLCRQCLLVQTENAVY